MIKKILWLSSSLLLLFALTAFTGQVQAQSGSVTGTVTDAETGETIPGANVFIVELERGAATDPDGEFTIGDVPAGTYTLNVTFVGFNTFEQSFEITAGTETVLDVEMTMGAVGLDEVVVSGYAVTTRRELTGSITSVSADEIGSVTLQNAESLLQGRAAGVNVITTSGNPGGAFRVSVRGNGSINAATEPLYIVDGVQISFDQQSGLTSTSPLNAINPSDIESIEVLKDASAASIYGSQAAAGVVLITTKGGSAGATQVTARAETGIRTLARNVDYLDRDQYLDYYTEAVMLNSGIPLSDQETFNSLRQNDVPALFLDTFGEDPNNPGQLANFNWQDFIYEDGVTQRYTASISGGDERTTFYLSGGYEDTDGTALNSNFSRVSLRTNIDHQVTDRFRASVRSNISRSTQFGVCQDGNFINCPTSQVMFENPMTFPFLADGSYNPNVASGGIAQNAATIRDEVSRDIVVNQVIANVALTYNAYDWLSLRGTLNLDYRNTEDSRHDSPIAAPTQNGFVSFANRNVRNVSSNLVANFNQNFDDVHNVSGLVGAEYRTNYAESQLTRGEGLPPFFNVLGATANPAQSDGVFSEWRLGSFFSNLQYNYDERYYLSVTGRYDGHSRFGADRRWAFFPSASAAWRISQEDFFEVDFLDELKLRAGIGLTGNSAIGNFAARSLYSAQGTYTGTTALVPAQLANPLLTWEEAREINVGVDYEILQGRISGSIDVYQKDNNELLFERPIATDSGYDVFTENIGSVRNQGIEFEIRSVNINTADFVWSTRFNVAFMDNEVRNLPDGTDISPDDPFEALKEGRPIGLIQVPRWGGVNPADGRPMWLDADGELTYTPVQSRDAVEYQDGFANTVGGFGNTFQYRGLTLDTFFNFSFGQWAFPSTDYYFTRTPDFLASMSTESLDRWRNPGDVTYYPRAIQGGNDYPETENYRTTLGTQAIYNASYIRLKNVTLSYDLPERFVSQLGLSNVSIFASGVNLLTWTAWPWYDPEVAFDTTDIFTNLTTASYPTERQVNAGIEVRF
jgi:TonB-dependent starch-binding outer membrane protein SusC